MRNLQPKVCGAVAVRRVFGALACAWVLCGAVQLRAQPIDAYFANSIWPAAGAPISNGVLVVRQGKILAVGPRAEVTVPPRARRHELGQATLIPGLVIAQSNLIESTRADEYAISPEVKAIDGFDPFDDYHDLLAAGITSLQISPGNNRLIPGQGAVIKLAEEDVTRQVLADAESLRIVLTRDALSPPKVYEPPVGAVSVERPVEPTQPQLASSLAQAIVGLRALWSTAQAGTDQQDLSLQALSASLTSNQVVRWTANSNAEIRAALQLSEEFQLPWIVVDPVEMDLLTEKSLWEQGLARGVILNIEHRPGSISNPSVPRDDERPETPVWARARLLHEAGAADRLALRAASDDELRDLLYTASLLGRGGLSAQEILKTVTVNSAHILGVSERVGSFKPDADADFVVLSGAPFASDTRVLATYSSGKQVYSAPASDASSFVLHARRVFSSTGVLNDASLAIANGKIGGLGADVSVPHGAQVEDFGEAVIVPGLVDGSASLGFGGNLSDRLSLGTELEPLLARDDDQVNLGRRGGVTTALASSSNLPSPVVAFKLTDQPRALKDPVAIRFKIEGNLTAAQTSLERTLKSGKAYADAWNKYEAELAEYKQQLAKYEEAKRKYEAAKKAAEEKKAAAEKEAGDEKKDAAQEKQSDASKKKDKPASDEQDGADGANDSDGKDDKPDQDDDKAPPAKDERKGDHADDQLQEPKQPTEPKKPRENSGLEPYRALFAKQIAAIVDVGDAKAVEVAVQLFRKDFDLNTALIAGEVTIQHAELLAENDVLVIVGPQLVGRDDEGRSLNYPAQLAVQGVDVAFRSQASTGVSQLPDAISYAVYQGLGRDDALQGLTTTPAEFFGLHRVGSLAVGQDADLVVLSGSPLELSTEVLAVMIDGKWVYRKDQEEQN